MKWRTRRSAQSPAGPLPYGTGPQQPAGQSEHQQPHKAKPFRQRLGHALCFLDQTELPRNEILNAIDTLLVHVPEAQIRFVEDMDDGAVLQTHPDILPPYSFSFFSSYLHLLRPETENGEAQYEDSAHL